MSHYNSVCQGRLKDLTLKRVQLVEEMQDAI